MRRRRVDRKCLSLRDHGRVESDYRSRKRTALSGFANSMRFSAPNELLVFMHCVDQNHSRHVAWISLRETPHDEPAVRLSDENERTRDAKRVERSVELRGKLRKSARSRTGIAPSVAGAVITADAGEFLHRWLDQRPDHGDIARSRLEQDRGIPGAGAVHVKSLATDVHKNTGRMRRTIDPARGLSQARSAQHGSNDHHDERTSEHDSAYGPFIFRVPVTLFAFCLQSAHREARRAESPR